MQILLNELAIQNKIKESETRILFEYDYKQKEANAEADWRNKIKVKRANNDTEKAFGIISSHSKYNK